MNGEPVVWYKKKTFWAVVLTFAVMIARDLWPQHGQTLSLVEHYLMVLGMWVASTEGNPASLRSGKPKNEAA